MSRFSKQAMLEHLQARAKVLKERHGFVSTDGWAQVMRVKYPSNESYIQALVDYGQYRAMLDLQQDVIDGAYR